MVLSLLAVILTLFFTVSGIDSGVNSVSSDDQTDNAVTESVETTESPVAETNEGPIVRSVLITDGRNGFIEAPLKDGAEGKEQEIIDALSALDWSDAKEFQVVYDGAFAVELTVSVGIRILPDDVQYVFSNTEGSMKIYRLNNDGNYIGIDDPGLYTAASALWRYAYQS